MPTLFRWESARSRSVFACFAFGAAFPAQAEEEGPIIQDWQKKGLLAALNDPSAEVLKSAMRRLVDQKEIAATLHALAVNPMHQASRIAELLKDQDPNVRKAAVEVLGTLGAKEQARAIAERLKDEDRDVRKAAVEVLGTSGRRSRRGRLPSG